VLSAPLSDELALFLRGGLLAWTLKDSASASSNVSSGNQQQNVTGTSVTFGAGARYDFAEDVGLRIGFQRFKDFGDENKTGQSDVDVISASLIWRFR
jgi:opacity protein-like surface antigen